MRWSSEGSLDQRIHHCRPTVTLQPVKEKSGRCTALAASSHPWMISCSEKDCSTVLPLKPCVQRTSTRPLT